MEKISIKIDGKNFEVPQGLTILAAAETVGIHIPNLCYLKGFKGIGSCRVCVVEIEGLRTPVTACTLKIKEGMSIKTQTNKAKEIRSFVIDLILSMHPLDCLTCSKAGVCLLQKYAFELGLKESSFTRKETGYPVDSANPFIKRQPDYCILCGRCVRACKAQGTNVLDFTGRGVGSKIITALDSPLQKVGCTFCGTCVDACPVNAITEADSYHSGRQWDYIAKDSTCLLCSGACKIKVSTKDGNIVKITSTNTKDPFEKYICAYGRFGFDWALSDNRVQCPLAKVNGELQEISWDEALDKIAQEIKKTGHNINFITSANILNEDALTLNGILTNIMTVNFDSTISLYGDYETLFPESKNVDIENSDLIMLVGLNPNQRKNVLNFLDVIIQRKITSGAKLIVINSSETDLSHNAHSNLIADEIKTIKSFVKAIIDKKPTADEELIMATSKETVTEDIEKAATMYIEAKNPIIFTSPLLYLSARDIGRLKGNTISIPIESNSKGLLLAGLIAKGQSYKNMLQEGADILYLIGDVPLKQRPKVKFLVVQTSHLTDIAKEADIVLPSTLYLESEGTIIDYLGRIRRVRKIIEPFMQAKGHSEIFLLLAQKLGFDIKKPTFNQIQKLSEITITATLKPFAQRVDFETKISKSIDEINPMIIDNSRLIWLKQEEETL